MLLSIALDNISSVAVLSGHIGSIRVTPTSDTISLEDDERIILRFIHENSSFPLDTFFSETGEFIRDVTYVYIIDDDRKCA